MTHDPENFSTSRLIDPLNDSENRGGCRTSGALAGKTQREPTVAEHGIDYSFSKRCMLALVHRLWSFGGWSQLTHFGRDRIEHDVDRGVIAALISSAHAQLGDTEKTNEYIWLARAWKCDDRVIASILVASVHVTLGNAARLAGQEAKVNRHFRVADQISSAAINRQAKLIGGNRTPESVLGSEDCQHTGAQEYRRRPEDLHLSEASSRQARCQSTVKLTVNNVEDRLGRLRAALYEHTRGQLLQVLNDDSDFFSSVQLQVQRIAETMDLALPPLVADTPKSWLWRIEFLLGHLDDVTHELVSRLSKLVEWAVDGGAHIGSVTRSIESANRGCQVIAVEAHPHIYTRLCKNTDPTQTITRYGALSDSMGFVTLIQGSGHSNSSLTPNATSGNGVKTSVPALTIDSLIPVNSHHSAGLIKTDLEGFDLDALRGADQLLAYNRQLVLIVEVNPKLLDRRGLPIDSVHEYLRSNGYVGRRILTDYQLSEEGDISRSRTANYLFAHRENWPRIEQEIGLEVV